MIQKYVNFSQLIDWLKSLSLNRTVNKDPYMDNALLNMRQILELDIYNPCLFQYIEVGDVMIADGGTDHKSALVAVEI